jgi:hypothetical protein
MSNYQQPAPQLTKVQEAYVLKRMVQHARSLPPGTSTVEVAQQLRELKPTWIREAQGIGQPNA